MHMRKAIELVLWFGIVGGAGLLWGWDVASWVAAVLLLVGFIAGDIITRVTNEEEN